MKRGSSVLRAGWGPAASQLLGFIFVPVLFRLYSPEAFGIWASVLAIVMVFGTLSTLRYELAIVTEPEEADAAAIFWLCLIIGLLVCTVGGIIAMAFVQQGQLRAMDDGVTTAFVACWLGAIVVNQPIQCWLLRSGRFGANSLCLMASTTVASVMQLAVARELPDHRGLIVGSATGFLFALLIGMFFVARKSPPIPRDLWQRARGLLKRHLRFPTLSLPFTLLSLVRERAPILLLGAFAPIALVGVYSQAWRLVHLPSGLTSGAFRPVVFHAAAREGVANADPLVSHLITMVSLLGAPWIGVLIAQPQFLFGLVLGSDWMAAGPMAAVLAVPALLFAATNWLDRLLDAAGRQDLNLKFEFLTAFLSVGAFASALLAGCSIIIAASLQSVALTLCYIGLIAAVYRVCGFDTLVLRRTLAGASMAIAATVAASLIGQSALGAEVGLAAGFAVALFCNSIAGYSMMRLKVQ